MPEYEAGTKIDLTPEIKTGKSSTTQVKRTKKGCTATLQYPNDTKVTLKGDEEIIKQLIKSLTKVTVTYRVNVKYQD